MNEMTDTEISKLATKVAESIIRSADHVTSENPKLFIETITIMLGRELAVRRQHENH